MELHARSIQNWNREKKIKKHQASLVTGIVFKPVYSMATWNKTPIGNQLDINSQPSEEVREFWLLKFRASRCICGSSMIFFGKLYLDIKDTLINNTTSG